MSISARSEISGLLESASQEPARPRRGGRGRAPPRAARAAGHDVVAVQPVAGLDELPADLRPGLRVAALAPRPGPWCSPARPRCRGAPCPGGSGPSARRRRGCCGRMPQRLAQPLQGLLLQPVLGEHLGLADQVLVARDLPDGSSEAAVRSRKSASISQPLRSSRGPAHDLQLDRPGAESSSGRSGRPAREIEPAGLPLEPAAAPGHSNVPASSAEGARSRLRLQPSDLHLRGPARASIGSSASAPAGFGRPPRVQAEPRRQPVPPCPAAA